MSAKNKFTIFNAVISPFSFRICWDSTKCLRILVPKRSSLSAWTSPKTLPLLQRCVNLALHFFSVPNQYRWALKRIWSVTDCDIVSDVNRTNTWWYVPSELNIWSWQIQLVRKIHVLSTLRPVLLPDYWMDLGSRDSDTERRVWEHVNFVKKINVAAGSFGEVILDQREVCQSCLTFMLYALLLSTGACTCRCKDCINAWGFGKLLFVATRLKCAWSLLDQDEPNKQSVARELAPHRYVEREIVKVVKMFSHTVAQTLFKYPSVQYVRFPQHHRTSWCK